MPNVSRWPKLSESLPGPIAPDRCQSCDSDLLPADPARPLERWIECGESDLPTDVVVVLCEACSKRLIKPHPRLYMDLWQNDPHPGAMEICVECRHRDGTRCPLAKVNGGPGLALTIAEPTQVHLNYGGGRGEFKRMYPKPASACSRREVRAHA
jgi:hypothetical protein